MANGAIRPRRKQFRGLQCVQREREAVLSAAGFSVDFVATCRKTGLSLIQAGKQEITVNLYFHLGFRKLVTKSPCSVIFLADY